jgi:hypothetical protein
MQHAPIAVLFTDKAAPNPRAAARRIARGAGARLTPLNLRKGYLFDSIEAIHTP